MRVVRQNEAELIVEQSTLGLAIVLGVAFLGLLGPAMASGRRELMVLAGLFLLFTALSIRRARFTFDAARRVVRWDRLVFVKSSTGSLSFDQIQGLGLETSSSGDGTSYRLTLLTGGGSIPIGDSYGSRQEQYVAVRERIDAFLKGQVLAGAQGGDERFAAFNEAWGTPNAFGFGAKPTKPSVADLEPSLRELVRQKRIMDAVTLLRTTQSMSLTEARSRVKEIEREMASSMKTGK